MTGFGELVTLIANCPHVETRQALEQWRSRWVRRAAVRTVAHEGSFRSLTQESDARKTLGEAVTKYATPQVLSTSTPQERVTVFTLTLICDGPDLPPDGSAPEQP